MSCLTLPPTTPPARRLLVPSSTTNRASARTMRPRRAATSSPTPPPRNRSGGGRKRSRSHQINAARGRQRTPRRPLQPPQTAEDLEAPLEAVVASSTTCLRSRALTTRARSIIPSSSARCSRNTTTASRVAHRDEDKKKDAGDKGGDDEFPPV